jgi:hypothetical protein
MQTPSLRLLPFFLGAALFAVPSTSFAAPPAGIPAPLPKRVRQPTPEKVVAEHMAAFSSCDWNRLMAQFPDNVEFFAPHGMTVIGRKALGEMFAKVVKPPAQGGTCGLKVTAEHTFVVGDVINVQWRADAPFLAEPYRGADAYETRDGLMAAQVTTFDAAELKMKRGAAPKR